MSKAIIFDFDGTLVDSKKLIYRCFQSITKNLAPEKLDRAKNILIGPPLRETASKILGQENQEKLDEFISSFIKLHDNEVILHTHPYPLVSSTLNELHHRKIPMAIATNKRKAPTIKLIKHLGWGHYFKKTECSDTLTQIRNKNKLIQDILRSNPEFTKAFFVGDTVNDGQSANLNKLLFIKANFGYGNNQDWSMVNIKNKIETFDELLTI